MFVFCCRPIEFVKTVDQLSGGFYSLLRSTSFSYYLCGTNVHYPCNTLIFRQPFYHRNADRTNKCNNIFNCYFYFYSLCFIIIRIFSCIVAGNSDCFYNVYVLDDKPFTLRCENCHNIIGERTGFLDYYSLLSYREYTVKPFQYKELCCYGGMRNKHSHKFEYIMKFTKPEDCEYVPFFKQQYGRRGNLLEFGCRLGESSNPFFKDMGYSDYQSYENRSNCDASTSTEPFVGIDTVDLTQSNNPSPMTISSAATINSQPITISSDSAMDCQEILDIFPDVSVIFRLRLAFFINYLIFLFSFSVKYRRQYE